MIPYLRVVLVFVSVSFQPVSAQVLETQSSAMSSGLTTPDDRRSPAIAVAVFVKGIGSGAVTTANDRLGAGTVVRHNGECLVLSAGHVLNNSADSSATSQTYRRLVSVLFFGKKTTEATFRMKLPELDIVVMGFNPPNKTDCGPELKWDEIDSALRGGIGSMETIQFGAYIENTEASIAGKRTDKIVQFRTKDNYITHGVSGSPLFINERFVGIVTRGDAITGQIGEAVRIDAIGRSLSDIVDDPQTVRNDSDRSQRDDAPLQNATSPAIGKLSAKEESFARSMLKEIPEIAIPSLQPSVYDYINATRDLYSTISAVNNALAIIRKDGRIRLNAYPSSPDVSKVYEIDTRDAYTVARLSMVYAGKRRYRIAPIGYGAKRVDSEPYYIFVGKFADGEPLIGCEMHFDDKDKLTEVLCLQDMDKSARTVGYRWADDEIQIGRFSSREFVSGAIINSSQFVSFTSYDRGDLLSRYLATYDVRPAQHNPFKGVSPGMTLEKISSPDFVGLDISGSRIVAIERLVNDVVVEQLPFRAK
jgi:hypothetical protein